MFSVVCCCLLECIGIVQDSREFVKAQRLYMDLLLCDVYSCMVILKLRGFLQQTQILNTLMPAWGNLVRPIL